MHFATGNDCSVPPLLPTSLLARPNPVLSFITTFWDTQQAFSYLLKSFFLERKDSIREAELLILGCLLGSGALERALLIAARRAGLFYLISTTTSGSQGRGPRLCHSDMALQLLQFVWAPRAPELWVTKRFWRNCCPQLWGWGVLSKHCSSPYGQKGSFQVAADADFLGEAHYWQGFAMCWCCTELCRETLKKESPKNEMFFASWPQDCSSMQTPTVVSESEVVQPFSISGVKK